MKSSIDNAEKPYDVVAFGEVLMRLSATESHRISESPSFTAYIGGSELNTCSGTSNLGLKTYIITCLPDNDIGSHAIREIQRMGVRQDLISFDSSEEKRLGLYYSENGFEPRKTKVVYDRNNSSFFHLDLGSIPKSIYSGTRLFHTTGITLALDGIRDTAIEAIRRFKDGGALISFDVNYRESLWDEKSALKVFRSILPMVDILFVSEESSRRMFNKTGTLHDIMKSYHDEYGVKIIATTERKVIDSSRQSFSSVLYSAQKNEFFTCRPYNSVRLVDRIGSGDAYDAGVLYGLLEKGNEHDMVSYGNAMAALKCTIPGDLPDITKSELLSLIKLHVTGNESEMSR